MADTDDLVSQAREIGQTIEMVRTYYMSGIPEDERTPALTTRQVSLLIMLRYKSGTSIKELAGLLGVTPSSVSIMVERLVEMGLLAREPNPDDRREVKVSYAPEFEKRVEPFEKLALRLMVDLLERLGPEHTRMWISICARLREVMEEERQAARRPGEPLRTAG